MEEGVLNSEIACNPVETRQSGMRCALKLNHLNKIAWHTLCYEPSA
jgi:hypothetical protein